LTIKEYKLAIGTAQFGLNYGINNNRGEIPQKEVCEILAFAKNAGINTLDTALSYGNSEKKIGNCPDGFNIISKFPDINNVEESLKETLKNLNRKDIYGYLFHSFKNFLENQEKIKKLYKLKEKLLIKKVGFSIYYPEELEFLLKNEIKFDIIQLPYNILDRRFEKFFELLKEKHIEIHVRSVFLQGIFFKKDIPIKLLPLKSKIKKLEEISKTYNIPLNEILLLFVLKNKDIDKVIIGIDSINHLKINLNVFNKLDEKLKVFEFVDFTYFEEKDEKLILPVNW